MRPVIIFLLLFSVSNILAQDSRVFVFLNSKPDKEKISEEESAKLMKLHLANIRKMSEDGRLLAAGPFDGGGGIFIFNSADISETRSWLQSDPAVKAGWWNIEIHVVSFGKGGACLVGEPYEMITYNFLRVNYINDIANYKMNNSDVAGWTAAKNSDSVIAVGRFPKEDGGFIVYMGSPEAWKDKFFEDQVAFEQKKLWVAKGAFCE